VYCPLNDDVFINKNNYKSNYNNDINIKNDLYNNNNNNNNKNINVNNDNDDDDEIQNIEAYLNNKNKYNENNKNSTLHFVENHIMIVDNNTYFGTYVVTSKGTKKVSKKISAGLALEPGHLICIGVKFRGFLLFFFFKN
jgi:hypothetical protein